MTTFTEKKAMLQIQRALANLHEHCGGMPPSGRGWSMFRLWIAGLFVTLLAACGGGGGSSPTTVAAPGAPSAVTVTAGDNETTISWGAVAGATSYNVYRSTTPGVQGTKIAATTTTSYVDAAAANGTTYYYQVTADNAAGEGSASAQSPGVTPAVPVVVPLAPTGLNATAGDAQVTLNWTPVAGARSYNVYRSTTSGSQGAKIGSSSTAQYVDTAVSNGSTYYYAVTADNAAGEGPASAPSSGVTPAAPVTVPAAPTGVNAVAGNGQVAVSWSAVAGATSYNVYRSTSAGAAGLEGGIERDHELRRCHGGQRHHLLLRGHGEQRCRRGAGIRGVFRRHTERPGHCAAGTDGRQRRRGRLARDRDLDGGPLGKLVQRLSFDEPRVRRAA